MSAEFGSAELSPTPLLRRFANSGLDNLVKSPTFNGIDVPHGNGEPVFMIPGYTERDEDLKYARKFIENIGYSPINSGLDQNFGLPWQYEKIRLKLQETVSIYGNTKVWGHSLGGFWGMVLSKDNPHIDTVIALGSPFMNSFVAEGSPGHKISIFSPGDGLVPNATSRFKELPNAKNVIVESPNHIELIANESVYLASAFALSGTSY